MKLYREHLLPRLIDCACGLPMVSAQREQLVPRARGKVLEIGYGSGLNLPYYRPDQVQDVTAVEPLQAMHRFALRRARQARVPVTLVAGTAEELPLAREAFDTVVVTYTLCSITDVAAALREMFRVLRPDGSLLFCEHGLSPDAQVRRWQHRMTPLWRRFAGGCHLDRPIPDLVVAGGFSIAELDAGYLPGPRPLTYNFRGVGVPAGLGQVVGDQP